MSTSAEKVPHSVLIVGLGNIGHGYDRGKPDSFVLSHSRAFMGNPAFRLVGGVDSVAEARSRFSSDTGLPAFESVAKIDFPVDVVVIAVPTSIHLRTFQEVAALRPQHILLEKPIARDLTEAREILRIADEFGISCSVNYFRRMLPGFASLKLHLAQGALGEFLGGSCSYSRGLFNTASHYIDLFNFLLGDGKVRSPSNLRVGADSAEDPNPGFVLEYQNVPIAFVGANWENTSLGEAELLFANGRVRLTEYCERIEIETLDAAGVLKAGPEIQTDAARYQAHVTSHLANFLDGKSPLRSDLKTAMHALKLCAAVIE